jgi:phage replication-related protein YjqB (UPF0714/DUF867 family)
MPTEYAARILQLRLPEQEQLKNEPERCSADPAMLKAIGRAVGQQVRIMSNFVALFTVKEANPDADLGNPELANVVRTGQTGRARLGTGAEMEAIIQANIVNAPPRSEEPVGVRFFEVANDDGEQAYLIAIAPHGGDIEPHSDEEARETFRVLTTAGFPASLWLCEGYGDQAKAAFDRWHITSTDLQPACFPLLEPLATRAFCYGVSFHGFDRKEDEADVYIGGGASLPLKKAIEKALNDLGLSIEVKISTCSDKAKFQGFSPENVINRLAQAGIHLEQSRRARDNFGQQIALAVARVFASRRRLLFCHFVQNLEARSAQAKIALAESLSQDLAAGPLSVERVIAKHRAFRATEDALAAKIQAARKVEAFIEEHIGETETAQPQGGSPAQTPSKRRRRRRLRKTRKS